MKGAFLHAAWKLFVLEWERGESKSGAEITTRVVGNGIGVKSSHIDQRPLLRYTHFYFQHRNLRYTNKSDCGSSDGKNMSSYEINQARFLYCGWFLWQISRCIICYSFVRRFTNHSMEEYENSYAFAVYDDFLVVLGGFAQLGLETNSECFIVRWLQYVITCWVLLRNTRKHAHRVYPCNISKIPYR